MFGDRQEHATRAAGGAGRRRLLLAGAVATALVLLGIGLALRDRPRQGAPSAAEPESAPQEPQETVAGDRAMTLVFPREDGEGMATEERLIPSRGRPQEDLLAAMRALCEGPFAGGAVGALPSGTRALSAFVDPQGGAVVVDFSSELVARHPGGSLAETATLSSILGTVALNFPQARSCTILVEGAQVETLAGHLDMLSPFDPRRWLPR